MINSNNIIERIIRALFRKIGIYEWLCYQCGKRESKKFIDLKPRKKVFFLMTPTYGNLGDQAIEVATDMFLNQFYPDYYVVKVHLEDTYVYMKAIESCINEDDFVIIQGGGNFGDLYLEIEKARRFVVKTLKKYRIISMPSSVTYSKNKRGEKELCKSKKVYNEHSDFTIISRDKFSYDFCINHFSNNRNILNPDMVFLLQELSTPKERREILVSIRQDDESLFESKRSELIQQIYSNYADVCIIDTRVMRTISDDIKKIEVQSIIDQFSRAKLVITDRLHGMIFSVITQTPCIVLPSLDTKILGTYEWIQDIESVIYIKSGDIREVDAKIVKILDMQEQKTVGFLKDYFRQLGEMLRA